MKSFEFVDFMYFFTLILWLMNTYLNREYLRKMLLAVGSSIFSIVAFSQTANFSLSKTTGCGNTEIEIVDKSSDSPSQWEWDFGNGVKKIETISKSYKFVYPAGTHTITLKVTKNGVSSEISKTIVINPVPEPDFEISSFSGCVSTSAVFTDKTVSENPIVSYLWGFGDGGSSTQQNPSHTYIGDGSYTVGLTVVDINGCKVNVSKENSVEVTKPLVVSFSSDVTESCSAPLTANFTSAISNGKAVEYEWNFGDGNSSSDVNPSYTYTSDGAYNVSLTAKTSSGCPTTKSIAGYIQINTFAVSLDVADDVCENQEVTIKGKATSQMGDWSWNLGNGITSTVANPVVTYSTSGSYTISVNAVSKIGCVAEAQKTITVHSVADASFTIDKTHACAGENLTSKFTANTKDAKQYIWNFGDSKSTTTTTNTEYHIYSQDGTYSISLNVVDKYGCSSSSTLSNAVTVGNPTASFDVSSDDNGNQCVGSTISLQNTSSSVAEIQTVEWNFSSENATYSVLSQEKSTSSLSATTSGVILAKITVTDADGCKDSFEDTIKVGEKLPNPIITAPTEVCYKDFVNFSVTPSSKSDTKWSWKFGDGTDSTFTTSDISYKYQDTGSFVAKVVLKQYECPSDTVEHTITINPPKADFTVSPEALCSFPGEFTFDGSTSKGALEYSWDFGDGGSSTEESPVHEYTKPNVYSVKLTTKNGACTDEKTMNLNTTGMKLGFTQDTTAICQNGEITFTDTSIVKASVPAQYIWNFGDGVVDTVTSASIAHAYKTSGNYTVSLKIITALGCEDSIVGPEHYVVYSLPEVSNIKADKTTGCAPLDVTLQYSVNSANLVTSYLWDFGDGTTSDSGVHTFVKPQSYDVSLTVTDENNCSSTLTKEKYITPTFPTPSFSIPNVICSYDSLIVKNTSTGVDLSYNWNWGDNSKSTDVNPKHKYNDITKDSSFVITLTTKDANGCSNNIAKTIIVAHPIAQFESPETEFQCPPAEVNFTNQSIGHNLSYNWNFGEPVVTPIILQDAFWQYYSAGQYDVTLIATDDYGCIDTMQKPNYITVNGPKGTLTITPSEGCTYSEISFTAEDTKDVVQYSWIYGDGEYTTTSVNNSKYTYSQGNIYTPSLTLTDKNGCEVSLFANTVTIYGVEPDFTGNLLACSIQNMELTDISVANPAPIDSWTWIFTKDGNNDTIVSQNINAPFDYGVYDIRLISKVKECVYEKDSLQGMKIFETPDVAFSFSNNPAEMLEIVDMTNETDTSSIKDPLHWIWQIGSVTRTDVNISHYFTEDGDIDVMLQGYTHTECIDTLIQTITINRNIRIPNVFTPNGDGINDIFLENMPDVALVIINRWGQELYRGLGGWDGTSHGQEMSAGTYFYMVTLPNGDKYEGPLMLIRN